MKLNLENNPSCMYFMLFGVECHMLAIARHRLQVENSRGGKNDIAKINKSIEMTAIPVETSFSMRSTSAHLPSHIDWLAVYTKPRFRRTRSRASHECVKLVHDLERIDDSIRNVALGQAGRSRIRNEDGPQLHPPSHRRF